MGLSLDHLNESPYSSEYLTRSLVVVPVWNGDGNLVIEEVDLSSVAIFRIEFNVSKPSSGLRQRDVFNSGKFIEIEFKTFKAAILVQQGRFQAMLASFLDRIGLPRIGVVPIHVLIAFLLE